jgi:hypothetical protein
MFSKYQTFDIKSKINKYLGMQEKGKERIVRPINWKIYLSKQNKNIYIL